MKIPLAILITAISLSLLHAGESGSKANIEYPSSLTEGAEVAFVRLKKTTLANSDKEFIPLAFFRRVSPEAKLGKWKEFAVPMPGSQVEPDLNNRVLKDFRASLPRMMTSQADAYLFLYEKDGCVFLTYREGQHKELELRAPRPKDLHQLTLSDFKANTAEQGATANP